MKYAVLVGAAASAIAVFAFAGAGVADPNVRDVPPHQHFIITAEGEFIPVGPQVCPAGSRPQLQQAFNQFHLNIHHSFIPGVGAIDSLGPQDGAPGLHNQIGADMAGFPCSFVPPS